MREDGSNAIDQGEVNGLRRLAEKKTLDCHLFTWFDTGNPRDLEMTRIKYSQPNQPNILEKKNETIWFVGNSVIKYSNDMKFISNRVLRANKLTGFVPDVTNSTNNMYSYKKVEGQVVSSIVTLPLFKLLLKHCKNFWKLEQLNDSETSVFEASCRSFYYNKTIERIDQFYQNFGKTDRDERINDELMPALSSLIEKIDWEYISRGLPGRFHGDFHFENILFNSDHCSFTFLDWRQDFGGDLDIGDIYYDLAKLLHGLIVSHEIIAANAFTVEWNCVEIKFDLHRLHNHVECEQYFTLWCQENGFDFSKVRILTALIYLNIATLHHYPYSLMLYALGKQMLYHELNQ